MGRNELRVDRLESRAGIEGCQSGECFRCWLRRLDADLHGGEWAGCDGHPATLTELASMTDEELRRGVANLRASLTEGGSNGPN